MRYRPNFILLYVAIYLSQQHLSKRLLFPHLRLLAFKWPKSFKNRYMGLFRDSQFYSLDLYEIVVPMLHCLHYRCFVVSFKIGKYYIYGMKYRLNFILLYVANCPSNICWKDYVSSNFSSPMQWVLSVFSLSGNVFISPSF